MKSICLIFQIHQPYRLKRYRFFDIGRDHYYYDDFANDEIVSRIGRNSYLPFANQPPRSGSVLSLFDQRLHRKSV